MEYSNNIVHTSKNIDIHIHHIKKTVGKEAENLENKIARWHSSVIELIFMKTNYNIRRGEKRSKKMKVNLNN
ncbi:10043_t:CDS:2 [Diversispora eburnea]|uniref:10043_t:CDS:1 n=1 Tax=Diversispora eburnea TaxID=1213867 RepID=A0A9N8WRQ0_9GLOM|nr:10043_t:CDS:2 [Diversispora eburnea]